MNLLEFGNNKLPSIIKDPFKKSKVTHISVSFRDFWGRGNWEAYGYVNFKNGNTEAKQDFKGDTFDDVVAQIKSFVQSLDQ